MNMNMNCKKITLPVLQIFKKELYKSQPLKSKYYKISLKILRDNSIELNEKIKMIKIFLLFLLKFDNSL